MAITPTEALQSYGEDHLIDAQEAQDFILTNADLTDKDGSYFIGAFFVECVSQDISLSPQAKIFLMERQVALAGQSASPDAPCEDNFSGTTETLLVGGSTLSGMFIGGALGFWALGELGGIYMGPAGTAVGSFIGLLSGGILGGVGGQIAANALLENECLE